LIGYMTFVFADYFFTYVLGNLIKLVTKGTWRLGKSGMICFFIEHAIKGRIQSRVL